MFWIFQILNEKDLIEEPYQSFNDVSDIAITWSVNKSTMIAPTSIITYTISQVVPGTSIVLQISNSNFQFLMIPMS